MPVVVTGADTRLGALVLARLVGGGLDLRATVDDRSAVAPLVAQGVKTAVNDLADTERLGAVLDGAHTVIHLRGADTGAHSVVDGVADVLAAAEDSGVERIVTMAPLRSQATMADGGVGALKASGYDVVLLGIGAVLAPLDPGQRPPSWPATQRLAPFWVDDLAAAFVAADRLRGLHGVVDVDAVGSDVVTGAELDRLLGVRGWRRHRGPARDELDLVGDAGSSVRAVLGIEPTPLSAQVEALRRGL